MGWGSIRSALDVVANIASEWLRVPSVSFGAFGDGAPSAVKSFNRNPDANSAAAAGHLVRVNVQARCQSPPDSKLDSRKGRQSAAEAFLGKALRAFVLFQGFMLMT